MVDKDALFDELSKHFPSGNYTTFCRKMGFSYTEAQSVLTRFKEDYNKALRDLLSQWDLKMKGVTRKQLEDALDGADVGEFCSNVDKHYKKASCSMVADTEMVAGDGAVHDTSNQVINQSDRSDSVHTNEGASRRAVATTEMVAGDGAVHDTGNQVINQSDKYDSVHTNEEASRRAVATTGMVAGDGAVHDTGNQVINQSDRSDSVHTIPEEIYNEKISESLTVQQCRKKLETKYRNQLCKIQLRPWDRTDYAELEDMHSVVTMVKKDARGKNTNKKEELKNSVSEVFSTKVNGILPARILISAPAGRGKTTAVAKMAHDWVERKKGSALERLPLLFVVNFRNTSKLTSIGQAIKSQLLNDVHDLTPEGLESFIRENQGICHIILDGLDEYAGISSSNRSSESNMVSVIRWEEFPDCRVLVTTRPHLENFFDHDDLPRVYTKMWIEGFSRESSCKYIDKFFALTSTPCKGQSLKAYLDEQPLIDELVKTPLFCLMICHVWSEGLLDIGTTTQTELLDRVNVFLMHYANERSKSRMKITRKKLKKTINQLGKIALTGLLDDAKKLVFTPCDFRKFPATLTRACELGIVSKTTVNIACLPQTIETTSTTIEFYHKLAQEHSAGNFLADQTHRFLLRLKISKLDRVLRKIKANIGEYENIIRFAAGTDNSLCVRIMKALLKNSFLDESERYRILLDCSSETKGTQRNVSALVQRCVNAQSIVLKSPTVYTVAGMQNLPKQLKRQVMTIKFEGSTLAPNVTSGLWSCLGSFLMLRTLTISDSSLSFPPSTPELRTVSKLSAARVTSQSYEGLLSSLPGLTHIDITIDDAEKDIPEITACLRQTGEQQLTHIDLTAPSSLSSEKNRVSRETVRGLGLLIREQTKDLQRLCLSGVKCWDEEDLVELVESSTLKALESLHLQSLDGKCFEYDRESGFQVKKCRLSTEMTDKMWSCLESIPSLNHLTISDSSLSFPPSPRELPSITKLSAKRVTSESYDGLLSSIPGLRDIDVTIDDAERDIPQITAGLRRTGGQQLTRIYLTAPSTLPSEKKSVSRETMRGLGILIRDQTKNLQWLCLSRVKGTDEEDLVELVECCKHVKSMNHLMLLGCGTNVDGRLRRHITGLNKSEKLLRVIASHDNGKLFVEKCQLSTEMTEKLWSCLKSFTSLNHLTISDSSLSFPSSPPELTSVTKLLAESMTSQSYGGLLSSLPGLRDIDITIGDAERDIPQITAGLRRTGGQQLARIYLTAPSTLPSEKNSVSRKTMRGLGLLLREQTKNLRWLCLSRVKATDEEGLVELVECCKHVKTMNHLMLLGCGTNADGRLSRHITGVNKSAKSLGVIALHNDGQLFIKKCQLSSEMTELMWSCLRSFTSLDHLTISDSSLSFPLSPSQLPSITKLSAESVTSQSYEDLLSTLPGLEKIDITVDNAERDIPEITAGLRRTGGEQLTRIHLTAPTSLPSETKSVSRETIRGLGLMIYEHTNNLRRLDVTRVKCTDEKHLVYLIECCRRGEMMTDVGLTKCGTKEGGRLESHLEHVKVRHMLRGSLSVWLHHDNSSKTQWYFIPKTD